jgi:ubiquinone/menaquinone biosynthesis C-methylase UbiE
MRRHPAEELLDHDAGTSTEIDDSLADLRRINHWLGGIATTRSLVERVATRTESKDLSLLEVAAGSGDLPQTVRRQVADRNLRLDVTLLDRAVSHLRNGNRTGRVAADAFALPFPDNSFDLVSSCLFAHHLAPHQFARFIGEALRVSRHAVLINDLIRHPLHLALVYAGTPLYRSRLTRHDAPASVRQAYTVREMENLLKPVCSARFEIHRFFLFRMGVIAWKY